MIILTSQITLKPGCKEAFIALAGELIQETRKEPGCLSYRLCEHLSDEDRLIFVEEWVDKAAIDFHNNTAHFTRIVPRFAEFCAAPAAVDLFEEAVRP